MRLSKPMIKVFAQIVRGANTIEKIAKINNKSVNFVSEILSDLEKEGFIVKRRTFIEGNRISAEVSNVEHAIRFKELIFQYPTINFEDLISDSKLLFLATVSEDWISLDEVSKLSGVSKHMLSRYTSMIKNRGIIVRNKNLYKINRAAWPLLSDFILSYKNYAKINGSVKWKYEDEVLFEVDNSDLIQGSLTGLAKYADYGVEVFVVKALCRLPKEELSKEEVFVHSLFQVDDSRTLNLALTFYIKNKLNYKKVLPLAMRYGKYTMFNEMIKALKEGKSDTLKFNKRDFNRIASMYGLENV